MARGTSPSGFTFEGGVFVVRVTRSGQVLWTREYFGAVGLIDEAPVARLRQADNTIAVSVVVNDGQLVELVTNGIDIDSIAARQVGFSLAEQLSVAGAPGEQLVHRATLAGSGSAAADFAFEGKTWWTVGVADGSPTEVARGIDEPSLLTLPTGVSTGAEAWYTRVDEGAVEFRHFFAEGVGRRAIPWALASRGDRVWIALDTRGDVNTRDETGIVVQLPQGSSRTNGYLAQVTAAGDWLSAFTTERFSAPTQLLPLADGVLGSFVFDTRFVLPGSTEPLVVTEEAGGTYSPVLALVNAELQGDALTVLARPSAPEGDVLEGLALPLVVDRDGAIFVAGSMAPGAVAGVLIETPPSLSTAVRGFVIEVNSQGGFACPSTSP